MAKCSLQNSSLAPIRRWPTAHAKEWVENFVKRTVTDPQVLAVVAVGSSVREGVQSNDLDLVAIVQHDLGSYKEHPPLEVDLRIYANDGLETQIRQGHDYLGWAVRFGVVILEKNAFWSKMVSTLNDQIPLPSALVARERAITAYRHFRAVLEVGDEDAALEQVVSMLTHLARAELVEAGVYPASRPELPQQLAAVGRIPIARLLSKALHGKTRPGKLLKELESEIHQFTNVKACCKRRITSLICCISEDLVLT